MNDGPPNPYASRGDPGYVSPVPFIGPHRPDQPMRLDRPYYHPAQPRLQQQEYLPVAGPVLTGFQYLDENGVRIPYPMPERFNPIYRPIVPAPHASFNTPGWLAPVASALPGPGVYPPGHAAYGAAYGHIPPPIQQQQQQIDGAGRRSQSPAPRVRDNYRPVYPERQPGEAENDDGELESYILPWDDGDVEIDGFRATTRHGQLYIRGGMFDMVFHNGGAFNTTRVRNGEEVRLHVSIERRPEGLEFR